MTDAQAVFEFYREFRDQPAVHAAVYRQLGLNGSGGDVYAALMTADADTLSNVHHTLFAVYETWSARHEVPLEDAPEVVRELNRRRVQAEARRLLEEEQRAAVEFPPFDIGTLTEILDRPAEPPQRIEGLLPSAGRMLVVAQRKSGKTTLVLNLAQSLIDGGHFLGRFKTRPLADDQSVAILNFEVSGEQLARWAHEVGVPGDRLVLVNLRGRRNPLDHPEDRERLTAALQAAGVGVLVVDPFGRAYSGKSQNDAGEVTSWLVRLDEFAGDVGASEVILPVHAGWDGERTRGSSALEDWADVVANLARDGDDEGVRYFRAFGRDVDIDEDRLVFEPETRTLTLAGSGSRKQGKKQRAIEAAKEDVLDYLAENPGCSGNDLREGIDGGNSVIDEARRQLVTAGEVIEDTRKGRGGGKSYRLPEHQTTPTTPNHATASYGTTPTTSIGGVVPGAQLDEELRHESEQRSEA